MAASSLLSCPLFRVRREGKEGEARERTRLPERVSAVERGA
jgi:hypothetical protein